MTTLEHLDALLPRDPRRAKVEIRKHLDGDLRSCLGRAAPGKGRVDPEQGVFAGFRTCTAGN